MAEQPYEFLGPGGQFSDLIGPNLNTTTPTPTKRCHHVVTTAPITTIGVPYEGFNGPVFFIADSVMSWTTSGNIAGVAGTTLQASHAYGFIYDQKTGKWYPLGLTF